MASFQDRAIAKMRDADEADEMNRAWWLLASAAIWALLAIAVAVDSLHDGR